MANAPDPIKALFARSRGQTAELAKVYLREKQHTGKLVTRVRSRALLWVWLVAIILIGFICFTLANTIGRSLLGLEQSLEHHRDYLEASPRQSSTEADND
ncbi:MAG: hypothetical protein EA402_03830 [Planctomycetota bacterium]|nr:MAG: hypothetical protein EA402_03830 [Planctomycetota bacterium]